MVGRKRRAHLTLPDVASVCLCGCERRPEVLSGSAVV